MDISKASLVICLTLIVVIAINMLIYYSFRHGIKITEIDVLSKITDRSSQPWKKEQEELEELSKLVDDLGRDIPQGDNDRNH